MGNIAQERDATASRFGALLGSCCHPLPHEMQYSALLGPSRSLSGNLGAHLGPSCCAGSGNDRKRGAAAFRLGPAWGPLGAPLGRSMGRGRVARRVVPGCALRPPARASVAISTIRLRSSFHIALHCSLHIPIIGLQLFESSTYILSLFNIIQIRCSSDHYYYYWRAQQVVSLQFPYSASLLFRLEHSYWSRVVVSGGFHTEAATPSYEGTASLRPSSWIWTRSFQDKVWFLQTSWWTKTSWYTWWAMV